MKDLNDRLVDGTMPERPNVKVVPLNRKAEENRANELPKVHSVRELLISSANRAGDTKLRAVGCTTGHYELDEYTGGFRPGFCWVFGADTSFGKSTWAVSVADENIKRGHRVLLVSTEDPPELYGDRLMARRARVNPSRIMRGQCDRKELARVAEVASLAQDVPVYVQAGMRPVETLAKQLAPIIRSEGIDVVVFDYLQEFQTSKKHQDERTRFKWTSGVLRDLIRSNDKAGVILSQLTISGDKKIPDKNSIRESRDVSNAAEVVAIGFCPTEDVPKKGSNELLFEKDKKYLLLDKNKGGVPKKRIELKWNEDFACFDTVVDPEQAYRERQAAENDEAVGVGDDWFDNERPRGGLD